MARDGHLAPETWMRHFNVSFVINDWHTDGRLARGYSMSGPVEMYMMTPSPCGDPNPEIYLMSTGSYSEGQWSLRIDTEDEICEVRWETWNPSEPETDVNWESWVEEIRAGLDFFYAQLPYLLESGVVGPEDDYGILLEKGLEGLSTFPIELRNTNGIE